MIDKIFRVKGMNDILPIDMPLLELVEKTASLVFKSYGFEQIRTPILEHTSLFSRSLGSTTEIVQKEMYSFIDAMNGDNVTLRPENTVGIVRAVLEHNLVYNGPKRLWYSGPMFRHERPQKGRYRQFYQIGVEALDLIGPDIDAELIIMCHRLWTTLGLYNIHLELNSIGDILERSKYRVDLIAYFKQHQNLLDIETQYRLYSNPLRILDSKNPLMQDIVNGAPKLLNYLGKSSLKHFEALQKILNYNNILFTINPRLVRGIDYYNRTVFEWVTDTNQLGAQSTICGGGRYDTLIEVFSNKQMPACGFAIGVERLLELMKMTTHKVYVSNYCDIYLIYSGDEAQLNSFLLAEKLRDAGLGVILHCKSKKINESLKSQIKKANASGATLAIFIGREGMMNSNTIIKNLRKDYNQDLESTDTVIAFNEVFNYITTKLISNHSCIH